MTTPEPETSTLAVDPVVPYAVDKPKRNRGVDLARGIAMFGMFAAHVGPPADDGSIVGAIMQAAHGRSSILFALLAGVSLALMTGGSAPKSGHEYRHALHRILVRAILLMALGTGLVAYGTPVAVILAYYGVFFLFTIPFLRMRSQALLIVAASVAVIGPVLALVARSSSTLTDFLYRIDDLDPIDRLSNEGITKLIVTGVYPAMTWLPYLLAGVAIGRIGIDRLRPGLLALYGVGLMIAGYGGAALAALFVPVSEADALFDSWTSSGTKTEAISMDIEKLDPAIVEKLTPGWQSLFDAEPHTGTTFEIAGGIGTALLVLSATLWLSARYPRITWPIAAVGTMSLTVYTAHVVAINCSELEAIPDQPLWVLLAFIGAAIVFATVWLRFFRRGPLEKLMHQASVVPFRRRPTEGIGN